MTHEDRYEFYDWFYTKLSELAYDELSEEEKLEILRYTKGI
jgi:hypothetical protein